MLISGARNKPSQEAGCFLNAIVLYFHKGGAGAVNTWLAEFLDSHNVSLQLHVGDTVGFDLASKGLTSNTSSSTDFSAT